MSRNLIGTAAIALVMSASLSPARAEPISLSVVTWAAIKAAAAYVAAKGAIAYGVTKVAVTKAGTVLIKKSTFTLQSGATAVAVATVSITALQTSLAEAGVTAGLTEDNLKILADEVITQLEKGETVYRPNACKTDDGLVLVLPKNASCGSMLPADIVIHTEGFIELDLT